MMAATMRAQPDEPVPVVTAFLHRDGKVLVLRRSGRVGTYRGKWAGVSGYLDRQPLAQARLELREEVGVSAGCAALRGIGVPLPVEDRGARRRWLVFPFLFDLTGSARIALNWESVESAWVKPQELADLDTVPGLAEALRRVWPPWGATGFWREMEVIANDRVHGATELALRGLRAVGPLRGEARRRGLRALAALHPSMGVFPHLAALLLKGQATARSLAAALELATGNSARRAARALRPFRKVLTHSASQACRQTLITWGSEGREVVVTESRPGLEGVGLARELATAGLRVTLITEAQIGLFLPRCDALLVGADAITDDNRLINKAGTWLAVLAAREAGVPAYAVAQTCKIAPPGWPTVLAPQEPPLDCARGVPCDGEVGDPACPERSRREPAEGPQDVVGQVRGPRLRTGVRVANIAFDSTPVVWFDGIFTEQGRLTESLLARTRRAVTAGAKLLMVRG